MTWSIIPTVSIVAVSIVADPASWLLGFHGSRRRVILSVHLNSVAHELGPRVC